MITKSCGVYVHIPFCLSKCAYCDFLSVPLRGDGGAGRYARALINEINACRLLDGRVIDTIYIGGGTPTVLPAEYLTDIILSLRRFDIAASAEFTVEANPGTVDVLKLSALKSLGANRLSLGLQAWQDAHLRKLGRAHTKDQFVEAYKTARATGFDNINIDVMFALPGQTMPEWAETLENLAALAPEHISAYALTIEPETPLGRAAGAGEITPAGDDTDRDMYHHAQRFLAESGFRQYEISNFAKPGRESRHNVNCWRRAEYVGFGAGAHSFFGGARFRNSSDIHAYIESGGLCPAESAKLTRAEAAAEFMFLGLRLTDGVREADFKESFGLDIDEVYGGQVAALCGKGLLVRRGGVIKLTREGIDLANRVFIEFI